MHIQLIHWLLAYYLLEQCCRLKLPINLNLSIWQSMATQAQSNHIDSTKDRLIPSYSHPIHLIKRGSQTACNRKLGYHDSCTHYKGSTLYPWVVIPFCHSYTSFGVWPRDHYMSLQRATTVVCHALLWFPAHSGSACSAEVSHTQWPLSHHAI
jgi:hypothetical protein